MSLAYANRSAVYIEVKLYQKCLENIKLAREHGYQQPEKLKEREERCKKLMESHVEDPNDNPWNFFKLSHPANEKLLFIVNCLELRENKKKGRFIVTNCDLKTGDTIAIDEPYISFCHEDAQFIRCANCLKSNMLSLIPCEQSCTRTIYCSEGCREEDQSLLHKFECEPYVVTGFKSSKKMVMKAVKTAGSIDKLRGFLSDPTRRTIFDFDWSNNGDPIYNINMLLAVNSLPVHDDVIEMFSKDFTQNHFFLQEQFKSMATSKEDRDFLYNFFLKQLSCLITNRIGLVNEYSRKIEPDGTERVLPRGIRAGIFPFMSLFNHSCDPNVTYVNVDNKICIYATRPIHAGEQVCISYFSPFITNSKAERQERIVRTHNFKCDCIACAQNYPTFDQLERKDPTLDFEALSLTHTGDGVVPFSSADAIVELKKCIQYIENKYKYHPCCEVSTTIFYIVHLMYKMSKVRLEDL